MNRSINRMMKILCVTITTCFLPAFAQEQITRRERSVERYTGPEIRKEIVAMILFDLRMIETAKNIWAIENSKLNDSPVKWEDIEQYMQGGNSTPPIPGKYVINPLNLEPEIQISLGDLTKFVNLNENPLDREVFDKERRQMIELIEKQQVIIEHLRRENEALKK